MAARAEPTGGCAGVEEEKKQRPGRAQPRVQRENSACDSCVKGDERETRLTPRRKRDQVTA